MARLALDRTAPHRGPFIRRVVVRPAEVWTAPFADSNGFMHDTLQGIVDTEPRVLSWSLELRPRHEIELHGITDAEWAERVATVRADVWRDILEDLAGPIAETRCRRQTSMVGVFTFIGIPVVSAAARSEGSDVWKALTRLRRLGRPDKDVFDAWHEAWALVRSSWRAVTALAEALLERHELDGEQIEEIVLPLLSGVRMHERSAV